MQSHATVSTIAAVVAAVALLTPIATAQTSSRPDLTGIWVAGNPNVERKTLEAGQSVRVVIAIPGAKSEATALDTLDANAVAARAKDPNKPPYKPELLAKVKDLEDRQSQEDPAFFCKPAGVPRMGPPSQIVQLPGQVIFLYGATNTFRVIPTDGRAHRPDVDSSYMGDSVGRWEGDTLVVDVTKLNDDTWLGFDGWFHTEAMHVTERLKRQGQTLTYQATVEDPNVFTRTWTMNPVTLTLSQQPLEEGPPCVEMDAEHMVIVRHH